MKTVGRPANSYKSFKDLSRHIVDERLKKSNELIQKKRIKKATNYYSQFKKYQENPVAYSKEILGVNLWSKQQECMYELINKKRILVRSGHSVGKSFMLACLVNWAYDSFPDLAGIGTGATRTSVIDVLFGEARRLRKTRNDWRGTVNPTLQDTENHYFKGLVVNDPQALHGRHRDNTVIIVDEATSVSSTIFEVFDSMFMGENAYQICTYNPVDSSSHVYSLESTKGYHTIKISCLDHPNIQYELEHPGCKVSELPVPGAINLKYVTEWLLANSTIIEKPYTKSTDVLIPGTDIWVRPNTVAETRILARWASTAYSNVWSDTLFDICSQQMHTLPDNELPKMGIDVARFGDDDSVIAISHGSSVLSIDDYSGLRGDELASIAKEKVLQIAHEFNAPKDKIIINVDENGWGASVVDSFYADGYGEWGINGVNVSEKAYKSDEYGTIRDELWFDVVNKAQAGQISFARLSEDQKLNLKIELLSPVYSIDAKGRKIVESKQSTKRRTKRRSPDAADATNLSFFDHQPSISITIQDIE